MRCIWRNRMLNGFTVTSVYRTKDNSNLKQHIKKHHLDEKDIQWFECEKCPYRSRYKALLKSHINTRHLDEADVQWFECDECSYRARLKYSLKKHTRMHQLFTATNSPLK